MKLIKYIIDFFKSNKLKKLILLSIQLELSVGKIYYKFYEMFPEDSKFWLKISEEENGHAALLTTSLNYLNDKLFPTDLVINSINEIKKSLKYNEEILSNLIKNGINRQKAFDIALKLEDSVSEKHYELFMNSLTSNNILKTIFQKLNDEDKHHYNRIMKYKKANQI